MGTIETTTRRGDRRTDRGRSWLLGLSELDRRYLLDAGRLRRLNRHDRLVHPATVAPGLLVLLEGAVKEHRMTAAGNDLVTAIRGPGDTVLLADAVAGAPTPMAATCIAPSVVVVVPTAALHRAAAERPAIASAIATSLARETRTLQDHVAASVDDTTRRVVRRVVELMERFGHQATDGINVALPLTQEELGSWAGVSRESTARTLHILREAGIVSTGRRHLTVHDPDELGRRLHGRDEDGLRGRDEDGLHGRDDDTELLAALA